MGEVVLPKASVQDAFAITDVTIGRSVRAMAAMACRRGPVHVGFDEVASVVRGEHSRALFGYGEAKGDNRAHEALDAALKCPLLDRGRRLRESEDALVQIAGGADLTLNEVQIVMEAINRHIPAQTRLFFGAVVDPNLAGRLSVTILSSVPAELPMESAAPTPEHSTTRAATHRKANLDADPEEPAEAAEPVHEIPAAEMESHPEAEPLPAVAAGGHEAGRPSAQKAVQRSLFAPITPAAPPRRERPPVSAPPAAAAPSAAPAPAPAAPREQRVEQMQFEPVNRGRFEKSEPTIVDGQDLDIPTFLRRNARLR
jgi:cell division protein FtsZ